MSTTAASAGLTALLQLERDARHADSVTELGFLITNETRRLLAYRQALLWEIDETGHLRLLAGSGSSDLDANAPYVVFAQQLLASQQVAALRAMKTLTVGEVSPELAAGWREFLAPEVLLLPLTSPRGVLLGGLLLAADQPWQEGQQVLLERVADAYGHAWSALAGERRRGHWRNWLTRRRKAVLLAALVILLFPLRQSVVVPASVVPRDPVAVAAPLAGVVKEVHVRPNAHVEAGDALFSFDGTEADSRVEVARKALDVAEADLAKNTQLAYACDECRAKIAVLQAFVAQRDAELRHALSVQARLVVRADSAGTAIFQDRNRLLGKPVAVGERIMLLARPEESWLELHLPVEDAITFEPGASVRFFLNIDPLAAYDATLAQTSYEAEKTAQDILAYTLMADFKGEHPRLGLKGTARLYGARVPLGYYVLRRPLAWLRQYLGW